ncbi:cysteine-rich repeat secretory protein 38-like [Impatiens glandulifera]|uniref:cysteine-rich repeat secretory protein 38-like n=1 Tax=Impatiens glandulifera TaxID=253017 RepID=UPI001FB124D9|nr:cysteine-rich repeat secretory protein 38-like [Impatiens glandulifera]
MAMPYAEEIQMQQRARHVLSMRAIESENFALLTSIRELVYGVIDDTRRLFIINTMNVSDPVLFNQKMNDLLGLLSDKAVSNISRLYAAGSAELDGSGLNKVYGLVQCTRDLSSVNCKKCFDIAISRLPSLQGAAMEGKKEELLEKI